MPDCGKEATRAEAVHPVVRPRRESSRTSAAAQASTANPTERGLTPVVRNRQSEAGAPMTTACASRMRAVVPALCLLAWCPEYISDIDRYLPRMDSLGDPPADVERKRLMVGVRNHCTTRATQRAI